VNESKLPEQKAVRAREAIRAMDYQHLLPSQRAELAHALGKMGLLAAEFAWQVTDKSFAGYTPVPTLCHQPSGYWFGFALDVISKEVVH
jgi:hypothetical protein